MTRETASPPGGIGRRRLLQLSAAAAAGGALAAVAGAASEGEAAVIEAASFGAVADGASHTLDELDVRWRDVLDMLPSLEDLFRTDYAAATGQPGTSLDQATWEGRRGAAPFRAHYQADWAALQEALNRAAATAGSSRVAIGPGTYRIDRPLRLSGARDVAIEAEPGAVIRWTDGHRFPNDGLASYAPRDTGLASNSSGRMLHAAGCINLSIRGLTLDGYRYALRDPLALPIAAGETEPPHVENARFALGYRYAFEGAGGIFLSGCRRVTVADCTVMDTWGSCFSCVNETSDVLITRCRAIRTRHSGFVITWAHGVRIVDCVGYACHNGFIDVEPNPDPRTNFDGQPAFEDATDCLIRGNAYHNDDALLPDELRIRGLPGATGTPSGDALITLDTAPGLGAAASGWNLGQASVGDAWYYIADPVQARAKHWTFRGECTAFQASGHPDATLTGVVFDANVVYQSGYTALASVAGAALRDNTFVVRDHWTDLVTFGADGLRDTEFTGNRVTVIGDSTPPPGAEAPPARALACNFHRSVRVIDNDFTGLRRGGFELLGVTESAIVRGNRVEAGNGPNADGSPTALTFQVVGGDHGAITVTRNRVRADELSVSLSAGDVAGGRGDALMDDLVLDCAAGELVVIAGRSIRVQDVQAPNVDVDVRGVPESTVSAPPTAMMRAVHAGTVTVGDQFRVLGAVTIHDLRANRLTLNGYTDYRQARIGPVRVASSDISTLHPWFGSTDLAVAESRLGDVAFDRYAPAVVTFERNEINRVGVFAGDNLTPPGSGSPTRAVIAVDNRFTGPADPAEPAVSLLRKLDGGRPDEPVEVSAVLFRGNLFDGATTPWLESEAVGWTRDGNHALDGGTFTPIPAP